MVRAKFVVNQIIQNEHADGVQVALRPVSDDGISENARYHKYTPGGKIEMYVNNPPAAEQFKVGQAFYVDFTPVEEIA